MWQADTALWVLIGSRSIHWECVRRGQVVPGLSSEIELGDGAGLPHVVSAIRQVAAEAQSQRKETLPGIRLRSVHAIVSDRWVAQTYLPWSAELTRSQTAKSYALRQLEAVGFDVSSQDAVRIDDAPGGEPRWAIGYAASMMAALSELAALVDAPLVSVASAGVAAWVGRRKVSGVNQHVLGMLDDRFGVLVHGGKRIGRVICRPLADSEVESASADLRSHWARMRLRDASLQGDIELDVSRVLDRATDGDPRGALREVWVQRLWRSPFNGASSSRKWNLLQKFTLSAAAAVVVVLGIEAIEAGQEAHTANARVQGLARTEMPAITPKAAQVTREELGQRRAIEQAMRELDVPFDEVLRALEAPNDIHVAVLSVEWRSDAGDGSDGRGIKVEAEGRTPYDMARYAAFLSDRKSLIAPRLRQHELKQGPIEVVRFTLDAAWNE